MSRDFGRFPAGGSHATTSEVRTYFESDPTTVSSPLTAFGQLTAYGVQFLQRYAQLLAGRRVLDAGAGLGIVAAEVARKHGASVVALDYSCWVDHVDRVANPVQGDLMQLPLRDAAFDTVLCFEVLEHTLDPDRVIAEIFRVLRPGGSLLLSTPSYCNTAGLLKVILEGCGLYERDTFAPFDRWKPKVLERRLTAFGVRRALKIGGFRILGVEGAELFDATFPFANRIPGLFERRWFLRLRNEVDRASSWPVLKWSSLHGVFHAERPQ